MKELGVGVVYWAALGPLLESGGSPLSVVELEPQTIWEQTYDSGTWRYRTNDTLLDRVSALPYAKLLHGVGHPLGGTVADPVDPWPALRHAVDRLDPTWVSEHLSFNRLRRSGRVAHAGFLLPPPQSPAAIRVAAHNVGAYGRAVGRPVAFETGVNYLRPRSDEMPDGEFFAAVAERANSGILLDVHNLWCNERNGRQRVADVLATIPLDRVWEIHLAGGMEESGYWLDAHSGVVPPEVMNITAGLIPRLPNLGALIFEVLPEHLPRMGLEGVERQLEGLQTLWALRPPRVVRVAGGPTLPADAPRPTAGDIGDVSAWETTLVDAIAVGSFQAGSSTDHDPGLALFHDLIDDFRRAALAQTLRYTMTALLAGLGPRGTRGLLEAYFVTHAPEPFGAVEADHFASFLRARPSQWSGIAFLDEVLAFEHACVRATLFGESSEVRWSADPVRVLGALHAGTLPDPFPLVTSVMRVHVD